MGMIVAEIRQDGITISSAGVEKPPAPVEYIELGLLPRVVGSELLAYERNPVSYAPGERDRLVEELMANGITPPRRPLLDGLRIPTLFRDPRVVATISAAFLIANR